MKMGEKNRGAWPRFNLGPRLRGGDDQARGRRRYQFFSNFFIHDASWCGRRPS